ncbi:hypothetical protein HPP92_025825 [Vanilla planifolia]|uniref:WRKY domain-containing protein n=2 Tax=Vanilla planifolia TaxID=51239 RepID=A0A835U8T6_VANPL|nr:hypothetical protein HPP92_025825 [Vanilla planifolia]
MAEMPSRKTLLLAELSQLNVLAKKLCALTREIEMCPTIADEIIFSVNKVIRMAQSMGSVEAEQLLSNGRTQHVRILDHASEPNQRMSVKRSTLPSWISHVRVSDGMDEGTPDDGCSWRKYGQKEILGAKYPRAYYRCTHSKSHGCPAKKQVQRSAKNPSTLDIIYRGTHTCSRQPQQTACLTRQPQQSSVDHLSTCEQSDSQNTLEVATANSDSEIQNLNSSFTFLSQEEGIKAEQDSLCFSPSFMSPSTSSPELMEFISSMTFTAESHEMDLDFMLGSGEMDPNVSFDTSIFFV